ncbi:MAG: DUF1697 domain-containing protein [Chloroflexi bacterium]|nr:DUF1697 domain-containing protein [Chloroflexota bacterium]
MPRSIAFLRAINVGGHTVKMDRLRQIFESLGFSNVETFIASGNVVFETTAQDTAAPQTGRGCTQMDADREENPCSSALIRGSASSALEARIAAGLQAALGYEVATFIRTEAELARIAAYRPFPQADLDAAKALNIAFLADPLDAESVQKLMALKTAIDDFVTHEREIYWLCRKKQSESTFSNAIFEKTLGRQATLRGANTVQKMAAKYAPSS